MALQMMTPNHKALSLLLTFCMIFLKTCYCNTCPEIEKEALLSFKQSLKDPSNLLSSWNASADDNCCNWKRVVCSNITGHVHRLHLQSYDRFHGLGGKIDPSLLNLKHLTYLDLSQNDFEQTIPSFIGSLTSLEYLNLSHAGFRGTVPGNIGNLSNLRTLSLENDYYGSQLVVTNLEWLSGLSRLEHLKMNHVNLSRAVNWLQVINTLPSLVELYFRSCDLNFMAPLTDDDVNNVNTSLAILDLSGNYFTSNLAFPKWIFLLSNLIYLDLSENDFEGPIPTITNTTKLQHIDLSRNNFNSTIPNWLYSLKDLEFVSLSINIHLQGRLSNDIANLTSLNALDLSWNQLSGEIPTEIAANLCNMQTLDLSYNNFQGDLSYSFGNMSDCFLGALISLDLSKNQLSGSLTDQFGQFKSLKRLHLVGNSLSGAIPVSIGKTLTLESLFLDGNNLTGNIPESVGQLFNLEYLAFSNNKLEGVVSESHFANLTKLKHLYASGNRMTLKVGPNWIPPFKLQTLKLQSWNLGEGAQIPSWLDTQKQQMDILDLSNTGISCNVPSWIWKTTFLNLSYNHLHGQIPNIASELLCLNSNQFSGPLPRLGNDVTNLDLSNNSFSGDIFHFLCDITNETTYSLEILKVEGNQLSGEIPDCWMKWSLMRVLNLGNNNMFGSIPDSLGFLTNMVSLNLQNNKFSGHIPSSLHNCMELVNIDLAGNELEGKITTLIGTSLRYLRFLIVHSNRLSGEISPDICHLNSLQILDLSDNKFSGIIPRCINNFTAMATKIGLRNENGGVVYASYDTGFFSESLSVATKGRPSQYDTILPLVTNIDLSKNNLSGDIPVELTSLVELRSLNLSGNHLTGLIPQSIGDMKQLESLDLSRNSLSGEMPGSFSVMSSLNYLNVSFNKLTGRITESTQIRGFDSSSFIGNDLCGPPLTSNCITSDRPMKRDDNHESGGKSSKIDWFYVVMSLGYTVGLSVFCTVLVLKKSWREAYYEFMEEMWNRVYVYFYMKWNRVCVFRKPSS